VAGCTPIGSGVLSCAVLSLFSSCIHAAAASVNAYYSPSCS
jgi:hypothetical protein